MEQQPAAVAPAKPPPDDLPIPVAADGIPPPTPPPPAAAAANPEMAISLPVGDGGESAESTPSWFTPKRLLVMFCIINMLNYIDRGVIASNGVNGSRETCSGSGACAKGSGIQGDFKLSYFEDGVLSSAFMVGLLVSSPIFASLAKSHNPFRLIGVGLLVWTLATAGCSCSVDFWSITICRMLVGVGEASFISLAAPFIDDNAPVAKKTAWLAIFYMCIPTGIAIGYVYGGQLIAEEVWGAGMMIVLWGSYKRQVGNHLSWRAAFWGEAIFMLPFAILGFVIKPLQLKGFTSSDSKGEGYKEMVVPEIKDEQSSKCQISAGIEDSTDEEAKENSLSKVSQGILIQFARFWTDIKALLGEKIFMINVLGYIVYNFVIGAYSYWGPKAGHDIYHMNDADMTFGAITIVCGILGTLAGGFILDRMQSTISNAFKLLSGATFLGAIFCFAAFCLKSMYGFIPLFSVGELLVFATQGPVNYICLHCVKPSLRPLSMAMSTVAIHIFGDVPSSPLVGVLQDHVHNWRLSALILTSILLIASGIWFIGIFLHSVDRFNENSQHERSKQRPLLDGNAEKRVEPA